MLFEAHVYIQKKLLYMTSKFQYVHYIYQVVLYHHNCMSLIDTTIVCTCSFAVEKSAFEFILGQSST